MRQLLTVVTSTQKSSLQLTHHCPLVSTPVFYTGMCSKDGDYELSTRLRYEQVQLEQTAHKDNMSRRVPSNIGSPDLALLPLAEACELSCTLLHPHIQRPPGHYGCGQPQSEPQQRRLSGRSGAQVFRCFEHGCGGRSFSNIENYRRHIREKTTNVRCPLCEISFTRKSNRDAHLSSGRCKLGALESWGIEGIL